MQSDVKLYDSRNIDTLKWPQTNEAFFTQKMVMPFIKEGTSHYIDNIDAKVHVLQIEDKVLSILVTTENYSNSWVCSPFAHYISYGKESLHLIRNRTLSGLINMVISALEKISRANKMNSIVYVNNWMFSTDLYSEKMTHEQMHSIVCFLKQHFPSHAIVLRSLNEKLNFEFKTLLHHLGFHFIASRYVYVTDASQDTIFKTRIVKSDLKLWKSHPYKIVNEDELALHEIKYLMDLYRKLYVTDHSPLQPQFNLKYFRMILDQKLLRFKVLKSGADIKGIAGYYKRGGTMMCPIFGYDKENPDSNTIYRLLNTALLLEAQEQGLIFHQGSGASFFKTLRRAEGVLEYMAIYTQHLSLLRRFFWSTLKVLMNKFGSKYMDKY